MNLVQRFPSSSLLCPPSSSSSASLYPLVYTSNCITPVEQIVTALLNMYPFKPAPAAAVGDISHLLKSREKKKKKRLLPPALSCESSKTVITSLQQHAAAQRPQSDLMALTGCAQLLHIATTPAAAMFRFKVMRHLI